MTGPRIARSASLLVGVMPGTSLNVQSAGYSSSSPAQKRAVWGGGRVRLDRAGRGTARERRELLTQRDQRRVLGIVGAGERGGMLAVDRGHLAGDVEQPSAELAGRARTFGELGQLAHGVRPAQLLLQNVEPVVADVAVGDDEPAEVLAQQLLRCLLGASRVDPVADQRGGGSRPQPARIGLAQPRRLIGMHGLGELIASCSSRHGSCSTRLTRRSIPSTAPVLSSIP